MDLAGSSEVTPMARCDAMPERLQEDLVVHVGSFSTLATIPSLLGSAAVAGAQETADRPGIAESLQVWTTSLADFLRAEPHAWHGVWHHQIGRCVGKAEAYARSVQEDPAPVRAVFYSTLPAQLDAAIAAIDRNLDVADDAFVARLLTIPEIDLIAVWITNGRKSFYLPLERFARPGRLRFMLMTTDELRELVWNETPITGLG
jgi:hypothetical protein